MMTLIGEKDRQMDRLCLFDHSMKPPPEPPEGKKSSLYKSPAVFEALDLRALDVRSYSIYIIIREHWLKRMSSHIIFVESKVFNHSLNICIFINQSNCVRLLL